MLVKSFSELYNDSKHHPTEECFSQLVVSCCNPPERLDSGEEILHQMPFSVRSSVVRKWIDSIALRRNARRYISLVQPGSQLITVVSFISDDLRRDNILEHGNRVGDISLISRTQEKRSRYPAAIDGNVKLRIPTTLGFPDGLVFSATRWIQAAPMNFNMRGVDINRLGLKGGRDDFPKRLPDSVAAPASVVSIN
jgi:hypothetical protein